MNTNKKGFTLVELMVTLVVFTIVIASVLAIYLNSQRTAQRVDLMTQAQQAARNAIDYMIKDIRSTGYSIDLEESSTTNPQRPIVYAGPYELIFNANINPAKDIPDNPQAPAAMKPGAGEPANYSPSREFTTGAETIVYKLEQNTQSDFTANPDDYALVKRVYGYDSIAGNNGGESKVVSIVTGPEYAQPIFKYYYDHDSDKTTPAVLWDTTAVMTPQERLDKIERIEVTVTGITSDKYKGEYLTSQMTTQVNVTRNASIDVYYVTGHVYEDLNNDSTYQSSEPGINNVKVKLSTGEIDITESTGSEDGIWHFAVIPGVYTAQVTPGVGFRPTTQTNFDFTVVDTSLVLTTAGTSYADYFGLEVQPTATIMGIVFEDRGGMNNEWDQFLEPTLGNITINVYNNNTSTAYDPNLSGYVFNLTVNAEETLYVWMTPRDTIAPDGFTDSLDHAGYFSTDSAEIIDSIDPGTFTTYIPEAGTLYVAFAASFATGEPCSLNIIRPNGGEILQIGETYRCSLYADGVDDGLKSITYYYSPDAGASWELIEKKLWP
ncbi:MAG: prepilin-type N-terminal cleavage/methylation domain-containing protein, partial [candidate division WOR-3 bacterium]|nr:prepilin-type N-terminal cleavage/methylation domain-containing protein [candidate division WOR-3 bacterium]